MEVEHRNTDKDKYIFNVVIKNLGDEGLEQYKNFLFEAIIGKHMLEVKRVAILDRITEVNTEMGRRDLV